MNPTSEIEYWIHIITIDHRRAIEGIQCDRTSTFHCARSNSWLLMICRSRDIIDRCT